MGISWVENRDRLGDMATEENLARTEAARLYTSHFNLRGHEGEVSVIDSY